MTNDNDWEGGMGGMITVTVTELEASSFQGNFQVRQNYCVSMYLCNRRVKTTTYYVHVDDALKIIDRRSLTQ